MIQRFFHPVGQGAFYSERHIQHDINIVYDCGTTNKKNISGLVRQSFGEKDVIHILFISHFDFDHVSLIDTLKKAGKIERVVIPLLHDEGKWVLSNVYKALGEQRLATLVSNPNDFFGEETQIISVLPLAENEVREREPLNVSERREPIQIPSGTPLTLQKGYNWVFVPYNYDYQSRNKEFLENIEKNGIDIKRLKTDPDYILSPNVKNTIKKIYKSLSGGINQNSMFLYSGPFRRDSHVHYRRRVSCWRREYCCYDYCYFHRHLLCNHFFDPDRVACLYTGDGDLNKVNVRTEYNQYWDFIGTIQIPHHGSLPSFDENVLEGEQFLCPISVGKNNSYGHPSQEVISRILSHGSCPILVTEDIDSTFVEVIE